MSMSIKKRMALGAGAIATVGAVATLVAGVTFGLFTSTPGSETNNFTAGTVTLGSDATGVCTIPTLVPGDSGTCTFVATYSGNVPALVALDTSTTDGGLLSGLHPLSLTIKDNGNVSYATTGTNLLVASDPAAPSNTVHTFTVSWSMPTVAGNSYEGATASLTLTAHAVQSANNGAITGCTAGSECDTTSPGVGAPSWS